ncbi:MAG: hypothetical protein LBS01_02170 [Prevotellaceae bacterium]|jgi:hypothetical protein|nr:hypothetical protein [Prevotellaceae bacterium]
MQKKIFFIGIFCCFLFVAFSQSDLSRSKITLKNGNTFVGVLVLKNETVAVLQADDGIRYQFPAGDIEKIESVSAAIFADNKDDNLKSDDDFAANNFKIIFDVNNALYLKNEAFDGTKNSWSGNIVLGINNLKQMFYLGVGAGYEYLPVKDVNISLLKMFFRIQKTFSDKSVSPYTSLNLGFSLISNENWRGGIFSDIAGGVSIHLGHSRFLLFGLNLGVQGCNTVISQTHNGDIYSADGFTFLPKIGLSAAIMF